MLNFSSVVLSINILLIFLSFRGPKINYLCTSEYCGRFWWRLLSPIRLLDCWVSYRVQVPRKLKFVTLGAFLELYIDPEIFFLVIYRLGYSDLFWISWSQKFKLYFVITNCSFWKLLSITFFLFLICKLAFYLLLLIRIFQSFCIFFLFFQFQVKFVSCYY